MGFKEKFKETSEIVKQILSINRYRVITIVSGLIVFAFLYYSLVVKVADYSIWNSAMMSGEWYVTESITSSLIIAAFFGINLSLVLYKYSLFSSLEGKGFLGFVGSGIGAFGFGCPTCGAFLFGLIGMPLALTYLPFKGMELRILSILILAVSIHLTAKSINGRCEILIKTENDK